MPTISMVSVLAHAGGLDEIAFVALPIIIFLRSNTSAGGKGREQDNRGPGTNNPDAQ